MQYYKMTEESRTKVVSSGQSFPTAEPTDPPSDSAGQSVNSIEENMEITQEPDPKMVQSNKL